MCKNMTFNDAVCNIKDIKTKCCKSCSSECRDDALCHEYRDIEILCKLSNEIQNQCPSSCGSCKSVDFGKKTLKTFHTRFIAKTYNIIGIKNHLFIFHISRAMQNHNDKRLD